MYDFITVAWKDNKPDPTQTNQVLLDNIKGNLTVSKNDKSKKSEWNNEGNS